MKIRRLDNGAPKKVLRIREEQTSVQESNIAKRTHYSFVWHQGSGTKCSWWFHTLDSKMWFPGGLSRESNTNKSLIKSHVRPNHPGIFARIRASIFSRIGLKPRTFSSTATLVSRKQQWKWTTKSELYGKTLHSYTLYPRNFGSISTKSFDNTEQLLCILVDEHFPRCTENAVGLTWKSSHIRAYLKKANPTIEEQIKLSSMNPVPSKLFQRLSAK